MSEERHHRLFERTVEISCHQAEASQGSFLGGLIFFSGSHYLDDDTSPVASPEFSLMCPDASSSLVIFTYLLVRGVRRLYFAAGSRLLQNSPPQVLDFIKT